MRILICGDRNWHRGLRNYMYQKMKDLPKDTIIIEGEDGTFGFDGKVIKGADKFSREIAEELGLTVLPFPANWTKYSNAAGPIRNEQMLKEGKTDEVWAFHPDITHSKGTRNMVKQTRLVVDKVTKEPLIPVKIFTGEN